MKKITFLLLFIPGALFANAYNDIAGEIMDKIPQKQKNAVIAILPFNGDETNAGIATVETTKAFIDTNANIVEREQIGKILDEQALQQAGVLSDENAASAGKASGAKYIIIGTAARFNKYGSANNDGIKISVRLIEVATYKTIAAANREVSADDGVSAYVRKEPKKDAEYPGFLELYGGFSRLHYKGSFNGTKNKYQFDTDMDRGFLAGLRLSASHKGFYSSIFEFGYRQQKKKDWGFKSQIFDASWIPTIKIPLWSYIPILPVYTNIYGGLAFGAAYEKVKYMDGLKAAAKSGFGFSSSARGGLKIGISESVSMFSEYRYYFETFNKIFRRHEVGSDNVLGYDSFSGHAVIAGISLAP